MRKKRTPKSALDYGAKLHKQILGGGKPLPLLIIGPNSEFNNSQAYWAARANHKVTRIHTAKSVLGFKMQKPKPTVVIFQDVTYHEVQFLKAISNKIEIIVTSTAINSGYPGLNLTFNVRDHWPQIKTPTDQVIEQIQITIDAKKARSLSHDLSDLLCWWQGFDACRRLMNPEGVFVDMAIHGIEAARDINLMLKDKL